MSFTFSQSGSVSTVRTALFNAVNAAVATSSHEEQQVIRTAAHHVVLSCLDPIEAVYNAQLNAAAAAQDEATRTSLVSLLQKQEPQVTVSISYSATYSSNLGS